MSDEFAICPRCKCYNANIENIEPIVKDENDGENLVRCNDCGAEFTAKEIGWDYVEYYHGKIMR